MKPSIHTVNWFEVPVKDLARATKFYSEVLSVKFDISEEGPMKMAVFPGMGEGGEEVVVHGALVQAPGYTPSEQGTLIYFNGGNDLSVSLSRVEKSGGKVLQPKMSIGEHGFIAIFKDSEGNRVALHSPN